MGTSSLGTALADLAVLVVDDEHGSRKLVRSLLLALGCRRIHEACDGAAGLAAIRSLRPDIVLLAWELPGIDGAELVRAMRSVDGGRPSNAAAIVLTRGDRGVLDAMRLGIHDLLLKPVVRDALESRLLAVLERRNSSRPPSGPHPATVSAA